jgi:hypothetical protein
MTTSHDSATWSAKLDHAVAASGAGSYVVDFPSYRPDLAQSLADGMGFAFLDFRQTYMSPLRFEAHKLPLQAIEDAILDPANARGVVLHNAEALLAAKPAADRLAWIEAFLETPRERVAVLPLALFGRDVAAHPRVVRFLPHELPSETLLSQIGSMRFS